MTDDFDTDEIELGEAPEGAALLTLAELTDALRAKQREVSELEERLLVVDRELSALTSDLLPKALTECRVSEFVGEDGWKTALKESFRCGNLKEPAGLAWLAENGHGDLVRNTIEVSLNKEDGALAAEIVETLRAHRAANRMMITNSAQVHWQTLAAFAKERVEAGEDPPLETLGVMRQRYVELSRKGAARFKRLWAKR